jgi:hypothetical protein
MRQTAEIEKKTAGVNAEKITTLGTADAEVVRLVDGERAKGQQLKVKAFGMRKPTTGGYSRTGWATT